MAEEARGGDTREQGEQFNLSALFDNAIGRLVPPDLADIITTEKQSIIKKVLEKIELSLKHTGQNELDATSIANLLESAIKDWIEDKQKESYYNEYKQTMTSQEFTPLSVRELERRNYNRQYRLWDLWVLIIDKKIKVGSKVQLINPRGTGKTWIVQSITSDCQMNFEGKDKGKRNPRNFELAE